MKANALTELRSQKLMVKPKAPESQPPPLVATGVPSLKSIRRKLEDNGIKRVSDSEAVRVALRHVELRADELVAAYRAMQADDRRRKQERGGVSV